jgi:hypothetical protein
MTRARKELCVTYDRDSALMRSWSGAAAGAARSVSD